MNMNTTHLGRRVFKHGLVFSAALLSCAALQAEDHKEHGQTVDRTISQQYGHSADQFLQKAAMSGKMEVELGQLAQQKGQSQEVKNLGQALVRDHTQANQKLQQLASSKNIRLEKTELNQQPGAAANAATDASKHAKVQEAMGKLRSQSGEQFDQEFVRMALKHHKKDIQEFEQARNQISDRELSAFIDETLPKLREHYRMAQSAARSVGVDESTIALEGGVSADTAAGAPAASASGTLGTRGSDKPSSPASNPDRSIHVDGVNQVPDTTTSGTINNNNLDKPRIDVDANVGDRSLRATGQVDPADPSISADVETDDGGIFQKGDGKVLGLPTDKNDGKFLGIIPNPRADKNDGARIEADVDVDRDVDVGSSATSEIGEGRDRDVDVDVDVDKK
jgi:putative membrane protein